MNDVLCWRYARSRMGVSQIVQSLGRVWPSMIPWTAARQASLSITNSRSLTQTHAHWVGDAIQPSHPLSRSRMGGWVRIPWGLSHRVGFLEMTVKLHFWRSWNKKRKRRASKAEAKSCTQRECEGAWHIWGTADNWGWFKESRLNEAGI